MENTLPRFGITTSFVDPCDPDAIKAAIQDNTKLIFGEVIGNPGLDIMDVEKVAKIADGCWTIIDKVSAPDADEQVSWDAINFA